MQLLAEIEKVKDAQLAGYAKGGGSSAATNEKIQLNLNALAALDAADFYNDGMLWLSVLIYYYVIVFMSHSCFQLCIIWGRGVKNSSSKRVPTKNIIFSSISPVSFHNNRLSRGCH
jgi:hypothetical protein